MNHTAPLPLRIVRSAPSRLVLDLGGVVGALFVSSLALKQASQAVRGVVAPFVTTLAAVSAYVILVRLLERRRVTELAGPRALRELGAGLAIGAALFATTIGVIALLGGYRVAGVGSAWTLVPPLGMALVSGVVEEIVTRGVIFRMLEEMLGTWVALVVSAALFGLAHVANPHATAWSAIAIAIEAGTLLAAAYLVTRRLWLAIGVHAAWNWTQGAVFGVAVSGNETKGWLVGELRGPAWISGGDFGAEASVIALVVCTSAAIALLIRARKDGRFLAPAWRRK